MDQDGFYLDDVCNQIEKIKNHLPTIPIIWNKGNKKE